MGVIKINEFFKEFSEEEILEAIADCDFPLYDSSDYYKKKSRAQEDVHYYRNVMIDRYINKFGFTKIGVKYRSTYWRIYKICTEGEIEIIELLKDKREKGFRKVKALPKLPKNKRLMQEKLKAPVRLNEFFWRNLKRTSIRLTQTIFPKESDVAIKFDKEITSKDLRMPEAIATYGLRIMRDRSENKCTYLIFNAVQLPEGKVHCTVSKVNNVMNPESWLANNIYTTEAINYPQEDNL